jgi:hypothetical protein
MMMMAFTIITTSVFQCTPTVLGRPYHRLRKTFLLGMKEGSVGGVDLRTQGGFRNLLGEKSLILILDLE